MGAREALEQGIEARALEGEEGVEETVPATHLVNPRDGRTERPRDAGEGARRSLDFALDARVDATKDDGLERGHEGAINRRKTSVLLPTGGKRAPHLAPELGHLRGDAFDARPNELGQAPARLRVIAHEGVEDAMARMERLERRRAEAQREVRHAFAPKREDFLGIDRRADDDGHGHRLDEADGGAQVEVSQQLVPLRFSRHVPPHGCALDRHVPRIAKRSGSPQERPTGAPKSVSLRTMKRSGLRSLVVACLLGTMAPALALADNVEDQAIARSLAKDGLDALKANDFKTAEDRFRRAEQLFPDPPTITLGLARSLRGQKRFVAAQEAYNRIVRRGKRTGDSPAYEKAVDDATTEKDEISKLIGSLTINVKGAEKPTVTLDGQTVNSATLGVRRPIDPGAHEIKVSAPGKLDARRMVNVSEAGSTSVDIELQNDPKAVVAAQPVAEPVKPAAAPAPVVAPVASAPVPASAPALATKNSTTGESPSLFASPWFWTSIGVTAAGAGLAFYGYSQAQGIKDDCAGAPIGVRLCADKNGYGTAASLNMVGYAVAGVGVAGALAVALWPNDPPSPAKGYRVTPLVDASGAVAIRLDY